MPISFTNAFDFFQHVIRTLALRVLREILNKQPWRFKNYAELTIMKALEAHKDPHKEVFRQAYIRCLCTLKYLGCVNPCAILLEGKMM